MSNNEYLKIKYRSISNFEQKIYLKVNKDTFEWDAHCPPVHRMLGWKSASGGLSRVGRALHRGGLPSMALWEGRPPREQNEKAGVKTLPSRNFVCGQ